MKSLILALPLLAFAAPTIDKRQLGIFNFASGPPAQPIKVTKNTASLYEGSIRETLLYGPFKINAANGTHAKINPANLKLDPNSDVVSTGVVGLCQNCMVLSAQADLAKQDGSKADIGSGVYSHHIIITNKGQSMVRPPVKATCPNGMTGGINFGPALGGMSMGGAKKPDSPSASALAGGMAGMSHSHPKRQTLSGQASALSSIVPKFSIFVGQGDEGSPTNFYVKGSTVKTGFFIGKNDTFNMMSEVVNYQNKDTEIYVTIEYEYIPNVPERPKEWLEVGMGAINVSPCASANLHPPAGEAIKYTSPPFSVTADGYLLDIKPHMHDGGINSTFVINGKIACTSRAIYGGTDGGTIINGEKWETITAYDVCKDPIKITKGDNVTMEAWYDLTAHKLRPLSSDHGESAEGMALALFLFAKPA